MRNKEQKTLEERVDVLERSLERLYGSAHSVMSPLVVKLGCACGKCDYCRQYAANMQSLSKPADPPPLCYDRNKTAIYKGDRIAHTAWTARGTVIGRIGDTVTVWHITPSQDGPPHNESWPLSEVILVERGERK